MRLKPLLVVLIFSMGFVTYKYNFKRRTKWNKKWKTTKPAKTAVCFCGQLQVLKHSFRDFCRNQCSGLTCAILLHQSDHAWSASRKAWFFPGWGNLLLWLAHSGLCSPWHAFCSFISSSSDSDHHFNEACLCRRTTASVKRCPHLLHVPAGCVRNVRSQVALQDLSAVISADTQCKRMDEILSCQKQAGKSTMDNKGYDITFGIAA